MRSGTLATHQLAGMGDAFRLAAAELESDHRHISLLRKRFLTGLQALDDWTLNGHPEQHAPGIINIAFDGVDGESLLLALRGIAVSSGSACMSATVEPSFVLRGIGLADALAQSAIRFSLGRYSTEKDIDIALNGLLETVPRLRAVELQAR